MKCDSIEGFLSFLLALKQRSSDAATIIDNSYSSSFKTENSLAPFLVVFHKYINPYKY